MSALDHMRMSAAVQPCVDTAISKTVNVPADYPFARFEDLYLEAWKAGLKGIATYRPTTCWARCSSVAATPPATKRTSTQTDPDRRIRLDRTRAAARQPALAGTAGAAERQPVLDVRRAASARRLRRVHRPHRERQPYPFEVWINGAEQPRGLGAIAKTLSMDMRAEDRAWLDMKLARAAEGRRRRRLRHGDAARRAARCACRASSPASRGSSAIAATSWARSRRRRGKTPVIDALMAPKEPKAGPDGTLSWTVDVVNPRDRRRLRAVPEGAGDARRPAPAILDVAVGRISARSTACARRCRSTCASPIPRGSP